MKPRRRRLHWPLALAGVAVVAIVVGVLATRSGNSAAPAFAYSVNEAKLPCYGGSYLPQKSAQRFLGKPPPQDWSEVQNYPGAVFANSEVVELHLQPETAESVTLEAIHFHLERKNRPRGVILYPGCFETLHGWLMVSEFDEKHPKGVIYYHEDPQEKIIPMPWTISLRHSFRLTIQANSSRCYCAWTADIPWRAGSESGTIRIVARGGKPFEVTYTGGLTAHSAQGSGWS